MLPVTCHLLVLQKRVHHVPDAAGEISGDLHDLENHFHHHVDA